MYRDNLETKHHFILLLKNADDARRDIEKHLSPEKVKNTIRSVQQEIWHLQS